MDKYELGKLLGQGNFAKVYYARNLHTNQDVAVKVIDKDKVLKVGLDLQLKREISIMGMLRHKNVLQVYEVMASKSKIYLVLEYAKGGELFNKVAQGRLKEDVARWVFQQLISAVDFCHSRGVCHRDLKLENLLLDEFGNLKVSDFGLSTLLPKAEDGLLRTFCGTPTYVAPEVIIKKGYDGAKADIWSCGVILYSMLAGHLPFRDSNLNEIYRKIRRAEYKCPIWFPPEVHKLLAKILDPNPKRRISVAKIKENAWFKKGLGIKPAMLESGNAAMETTKVDTENAQEEGTFSSMNAFEFISLSSGFDLSGLFVEDEQREDVRFISREQASDIALKLKEVAAEFRMEVVNKEGVFFRMQRVEEEGHGLMMLDVEVFEFTNSFHLVQLKKSGGDSLDFRKVMKDMKLALRGIAWAWQDNRIFKPEQLSL